MKILYLGDLVPGQTSRMRMRALERLGHSVYGVDTVQPWRAATWLQRQIQRKVNRGSVVDRINEAVVSAAKAFKPEMVWADKQEYVRAESLMAMRKAGARLVSFTPDPYFFLAWKRTALMDQALRIFDLLVYCKSYEQKAYQDVGTATAYMPLGYCDEVHRPLPSSDPRWLTPLGFLGGWEPRREEFLAPVAKLGVGLKIWGGYWDFLKDGRWSLRRHVIMNQLAGGQKYKFTKNPSLAACLQGGEVYDDSYARALTGSTIGIGFLRQVCPDQHTTRTFEIPACGSMLLADRTEEHQEFFEEGKEAEYFGSKEELLDKASFYTKNEGARAAVAHAGRQRCIDGRYAYVERMAEVMNYMRQL